MTTPVILVSKSSSSSSTNSGTSSGLYLSINNSLSDLQSITTALNNLHLGVSYTPQFAGLLLSNSTTPTILTLHNTYTDASNYERLKISAITGGAYTITSEAAGTGTIRNMALMGSNVGIGTNTPRKLTDFLSTVQAQLRLSYTDNTVYTDFTTLSTGNLTIAPSNSFATLTGTFSPTVSDGGALGTTSLMWSDLFLASGGVLSFNNGNITLTHSAGILTFNGGTLAMGANNITMTGTLGATGARLTDGFFTGLTVTNLTVSTSFTLPNANTLTGNSGKVTFNGGIDCQALACTSLTCSSGFGCNGASAQGSAASGGSVSTSAGDFGFGADSERSALTSLVNNIRSALVSNRIMS